MIRILCEDNTDLNYADCIIEIVELDEKRFDVLAYVNGNSFILGSFSKRLFAEKALEHLRTVMASKAINMLSLNYFRLPTEEMICNSLQ